MVRCPTCGPVITVSSSARGGDIGYCRICGNQHRLHRDGGAFVAEPTGAKGSAEELKPRPETGSIETMISQAPPSVNI